MKLITEQNISLDFEQFCIHYSEFLSLTEDVESYQEIWINMLCIKMDWNKVEKELDLESVVNSLRKVWLF